MRSLRSMVARLALAAAFMVPLLLAFCPPAAQGAGVLSWPLEGAVVRGFEKPTGHYGEGGHQGLDIAAEPGEAVRAVADGTVAWVGEVPRGVFVSIEHAGGLRSTCLDLRDVLVRRGDRVPRGRRIASVHGSRDDSSRRTHLHFDTYLNGQPVDPRLLLGGGLDAGSFVRLCPVRQPGGGAFAGTWSGEGRGLSSGRNTAPETGGEHGVLRLLRRGACALGRGTVRVVTFCWERVLRPAGRAMGGFCRLAWSNRYVQAAVAGLAAAVVVVVGVIAAFILLPISVLTAVVAGIAGALACLGMALYYAATSAGDFTFAACFLKGLAAGTVVASGVLSWAALAPSLSAGWAKVGLAGMLRAAAWNGIFSAAFDTGLNFLATGRFSPGRAAVSFIVGAATGAVGKVIKRGITTERFLRLFSIAGGHEFRLQALGRSAAVLLARVTVRVEGFLYLGRGLALELGGRVAYVLAWGSMTAVLNAVSCAAARRPITATGVISSFVVGAVMGTVTLSFDGRGIGGLIERLRIFRRVPAAARRFAAKLIGKGTSRTLDRTVRSGLKKVLDEKEARVE